MTFNISNLWNSLMHSSSVVYPAYSIPESHVVASQHSEVEMRKDSAYFELRICEQFLRDRREYWNEYNPLTLVATEFIYDKTREMLPFVVGPGLLKRIEELEGDERVCYRNTRVVGPTPYRGDDVSLFLGLFRVKTKDWARQALSLLESTAKAFDSSKLSSYLNIADPLMTGIENFIGMGNQMQFRLGQRDSFVDPEIHNTNVFKPGYFVIIRDDKDAPNKNNSWVKDNRLYIGSDSTTIKPYRRNDFVLYKITSHKTRNDFTTFDFHKQWEKVQDTIWYGDKVRTIEGFHHLVGMIRRCKDLIPSHMNQLATYYENKTQEEWNAYQQSLTPSISNERMVDETMERYMEQIHHIDVNKEAKRAMTVGLDYFRSESMRRPIMPGPKRIVEADILNALNSSTLNDPSIKFIEPDTLISALSFKMPIMHGVSFIESK